MNFEDLRQAVSEVLATGRIGAPVAVRLHFRLPDLSDAHACIAAALVLAEDVFSARPRHLSARYGQKGWQCSALFRYPAGQTLLVTALGGPAADSSAHMLLVGNHGMVRLEGGEWSGALPAPAPDALASLKAAAERSAAAGAFVPLE